MSASGSSMSNPAPPGFTAYGSTLKGVFSGLQDRSSSESPSDPMGDLSEAGMAWGQRLVAVGLLSGQVWKLGAGPSLRRPFKIWKKHPDLPQGPAAFAWVSEVFGGNLEGRVG